MRFELPPDKRALSKEQLLADLRRASSDIRPVPLTMERYDLSGGLLSASGMQRRFGSWSNALRAAGVEIAKNANFNGKDEDYFEVIETIWQKLGRPPKREEVLRPESRVSGGSITRHFGCPWRQVLERFVEQINLGSPEVDWALRGSLAGTDEPARRRTCRSIGWRLRFLVLRRDGFRCRLCGASPAITPGVHLQVDHMEPWANGGETVLENLQSTCDRCNGGKSALPLHEGGQTQAPPSGI
jgi:hypothetical protein